MVSLIDSHCHIDFYKDWQEKVKNAKSAGVGIIVNNGLDPVTNKKTLEMAKQFPEVKAALGVYPDFGLKMSLEEIDKEIDFIRKNKDNVFAIGEVGLDYAKSPEKEDLQKERQINNFRKFVKLAMELDKAIIVHSRKAELECIEILEEMKAKKVVMHCFSGKFKLAKRIEKNGWTLSIPTSICYAEQFQKIAKEISLSNIILETDSPYMHPDRSVREPENEPALILEGYKKLAEIKGLDLEEIKNMIFMNWQRLM